jgi:acetylornithine deacetylase/succinyl-diaminopimelate desuccinylase-like protein
LRPTVVHAGRSAWFRGTSERGGGLVCWIELLRALTTGRPLRDVLFVATAGDELGHIGLQAFLSTRADLARSAQAWLELGESLGAAQVDDTVLYASTSELAGRATEILAKGGVRVDDTMTGQRPPGGMALVHDAGGSYAALIGRGNPFARTSSDRWPQAVDVADVLRFARAFVKVGLERATEP